MRLTLNWYRKKRTFLPPDQAEAPVASNIQAQGVTLTWNAVPTATLYRLEQSVDNVNWTETVVTVQLTYDVTGLTQSSLYYFRVSAGSARGGYGLPSETSIVTLDNLTPPATPTSPPTELDHGATTASIAWASVATASAYELWRSTNPTTGFTKVYDGTALLFNDSLLSNTTTYYYKYLAKNADGASGFSPNLTVVTDSAATTPPTPAAPTASNVTSSSAQITWTNSGGATDSELQRRQTAPTVTAFVTVYTGQNFTFLQTGLSPDSTYEFKVRESNSAGTSAYSPVRTITTGGVTGTNVQPVSALSIREKMGVVGHANFNTGTVYNFNWRDDQLRLVSEAGYTFLRSPTGQWVDEYAATLRKYNMKWEVTMGAEGAGVPTSNTIAETRANVREVREKLADICKSVDGINEPNHNRDGSPLISNWADITVDHQRAIWQEARWNLTSVGGPIGSSATAGSVLNPLRNVPVLGPALHDIAADNSYPDNGRHFHQLLNLGILNYQTHANLHSYNGGGAPEKSKMDDRIALMESAYGAGYPVAVSEWGYHNAIATTAGHKPITEAGAAVYVPRGYLQNCAVMTPGGTNRNLLFQANYEIFDDLDPDPKNEHEKNFGVIGYSPSGGPNQPSTWRKKPEAQAMQALNAKLRDPLGTQPYVPSRVTFTLASSITGNALHWVVTATKAQSDAGTATAWVWRELDVWNPTARTTIAVSDVSATVTDRVGTRTFSFGPEPRPVDLR